MSTSLATQHPTIGTLQISDETRLQIDSFKGKLAAFVDVEITDENFRTADTTVAQAATLKKLIEKDAKAHTDEIKLIEKSIKVDLDRHLRGLTVLLQPLTAKVAAYSTRKEQERQAAIEEKRRLDNEERARKAAEADRIRKEKEEKAAAVREKMRIDQERQEAAIAGEPLPPPMLMPIPSVAPANTPAPIAPTPVAQLVEADLGKVTARPAPFVPPKVQSSVRTRTVQKLVITDETAIPTFSLSGALLRKIDQVAVRAALLAGEAIPGAHLVEETTSFAVGG